ncbi:hypothetical protein [Deinococcus aquaedulcis]|uniref:hypothetical protein n=1 Tax=Deinococcus aquaedulcis TaxID=2840455 RepID=UPI001C82B6A8|nr:hypothetical protein [Deinococcus aquaedulcis]
MKILTLLQDSGTNFLGVYVSREMVKQATNSRFECIKMRKGVYQCQNDNLVLFFHDDMIDTIEVVLDRFQLSELIEWNDLPLDRNDVMSWLKDKGVKLASKKPHIRNGDSIFTASGAELKFTDDRLERIRFTFE